MKKNKMSRVTARRNQKGFGMALALAVLAIFAVIAGVISMANRSGVQKTDSETGKAMAQGIINQGNNLFSATVRATQDRDVKNMLLATTGTSPAWGLYDPIYGFASDIAIPGKAMSTTVDTSFTLNSTSIKIIGIGSGGSDQLAVSVILPNVTSMVCQQVNRIVSGDSIDTAVPVVVATTAISRREGCASIGANLTYYKVMGSAV